MLGHFAYFFLFGNMCVGQLAQHYQIKLNIYIGIELITPGRVEIRCEKPREEPLVKQIRRTVYFATLQSNILAGSCKTSLLLLRLSFLNFLLADLTQDKNLPVCWTDHRTVPSSERSVL